MVHERVHGHVHRSTARSSEQGPTLHDQSTPPAAAPAVAPGAPGPWAPFGPEQPSGGEPVVAELPGGGAVPPVAEVPAVERPLDPRAIARASLQASRNASLWWTGGGVVVACVVALVAGTAVGAWTLSAMLAAAAGVRAVRPEPGPVALSVRSRAVDVTILCFLAISIAVLAALLPTPEV